MPKAKPQGPKVFIVPELMPNEPTGVGSLLEEHLKADRSRGSRLRMRGTPRGVPAKTLEWRAQTGRGALLPSARELADMPGVEKQRWATWEVQHWLDASLKKLLSGKSARDVFKLDTRKSARPSTAARDRNLCAEVLRLMERCDYKRPQAIERVAEAFALSVRVVEQATELWVWDAAGKKEQHRFVPLWEQKLRNAGKLK